MIAAAPAANPWAESDWTTAVMSVTASTSITGFAANGAAPPNNPKRWTTTPTEILHSGGLDATQATNYHDALTGMVSAGQINRSFQQEIYGTCNTQKFAIRMLGTGSPMPIIQVGSKFIDRAGHTLAGSSGVQYLTVDRGVGFDPALEISIWSTGQIDGIYPESGGVITPASAPYPKSIIFNGDSITDGGGPTFPQLGYASQVAYRLGFRRCIANGVTGTGYLADSGGSLYYTVRQRIPNMTGVNNTEMIAAGATNNPDMILGVFVAGVNDLVSGYTAAQVGAECALAIQQFRREAPGVPLIVFDSWDRNAPSAPEAGYADQSAAIRAACAGYVDVKFRSLQNLTYSKADATHPNDAGAIQQADGVVTLITEAISELAAGITSQPYDLDVLAWRDAVVANGGSVTLARLAIVNTFVRAEKDAGTWALTDDYWIPGANAPQALTSLKQRRLATAVNSPTFTADRDYAFDGVSSYINTGFIPSTHGINYTGTSQRVAIYERTNLSASGTAAGCRVGTSASISIVPRNGSSMSGTTNNSAGSVAFALNVADSRGLKSISRANGGTTALGFERGVKLTDATGLTVGTSAPSVALAIGCLNSSGVFTAFRAASVAFAAIGGALSSTQEAAQQTNVEAMAAAIGWAV